MARVTQTDEQKVAEQNADQFLVDVLSHWKGNVATTPQERGKAQALIIRISRRMANRFTSGSESIADVFAN